MENVCRLCGLKKRSRAFVSTIDDETLNIKQKLIVCCRWNSIGVSDYINLELPKKICKLCLINLEKCWIFAESVAHAQEFLLSHIVEIKTEVFVSDGIDEMPEDIVEQSDDSDELKTSLDAYLPIDYEEYYSHQSEIDQYLQSVDENANVAHTLNDSIQKRTKTRASSEHLCAICGRYFSSKENLITHTKTHIAKEERKHYECYICKTTFSYKKSLIQHMPIHCGKKVKYQCGVCQLHFSRLDSLKRHTLIHMGQQPHECETCGKGFRTKFHLKVILIVILNCYTEN